QRTGSNAVLGKSEFNWNDSPLCVEDAAAVGVNGLLDESIVRHHGISYRISSGIAGNVSAIHREGFDAPGCRIDVASARYSPRKGSEARQGVETRPAGFYNLVEHIGGIVRRRRNGYRRRRFIYTNLCTEQRRRIAGWRRCRD